MTETRALAVRPLTPDIWQMIERIAPTFYKSRIFGVNSVEQAAAIMVKGFEIGLPLAASFEFISVVQGRPTLSPRGALALVLQSGLLEDMRIEEQPDRCTVYMKRRNGPSYQMTWTLDDAKRAGVVRPNSAWETYPSNMLRWRALGFVIDVLFADVTGGLKRADEFGADITEDGQVIPGQWSAVPNRQSTEPNDQSSQRNDQSNSGSLDASSDHFSAITLDELLALYGAEAVIVANEGKIPATQGELAEIAKKLATAEMSNV